MAAEWYYVANRQQVGPVEFYALQSMLQSGTLSPNDLVFGPGLSEWTAAGRIPGLSAPVPMASPAPMGAPMGMPGQPLGYRGYDTGTSNISQMAVEMLRQTKPWVRFVAVMTFIGAGLMILAGIGMLAVGASSRSRMFPVEPAILGMIYFVFGGLYFIPANYLNRYANKIGDLLRSNGTRDLEGALEAQKSFWKFSGIMLLIVLILYAIIIIIAIGSASRF